MKVFRRASLGALVLAASISFAQSKPGDIVADIPFSFNVVEQTLPAGHYVVSRINGNLSIHDLRNRGAFAPAHSAQRAGSDNTTKMVFHRYGDTYFLAEVWTGSEPIGARVFSSRAEREMAESGKEREIAILRPAR